MIHEKFIYIQLKVACKSYLDPKLISQQPFFEGMIVAYCSVLENDEIRNKKAAMDLNEFSVKDFCNWYLTNYDKLKNLI